MPKESAREKALRRAAAAAQGEGQPDPAKAATERYVVASALITVNYGFSEPEGNETKPYAIVWDRQEEEVAACFPDEDAEAAEGFAWAANAEEKRRINRAAAFARERAENVAASRGDVLKVGRRYAVVTEVRSLDAGWGYVAHWLLDGSRRLGEATYTTSLSPLESLGRWTGSFMREGAVGAVVLKDQPETPGTDPEKESVMAKVTTKAGKKKPAAKPAAANDTTRRTKEDVDALVPTFVEHLSNGGKMKELKAEHGFSDDGPIRAALYRNGYDSKGEEHGEEAKSITATNKAGKAKVAKLRADEAAPWYRLAYLTGLTESEVKAIVAEVGGEVSGRVYKEAEAKPAASKKPAAKAAGKKSGKAAKAKAADPS